MVSGALSLFFLLSVPVALVIWVLVAKHRLRHDWEEAFLYFPVFLLAKLLWRTEFDRAFPVPRDRGCVVISNHRSSVDPFFLQVVARRRVHWMVAKEFCEFWAFRGFLRGTQAIPTQRAGADLEATRTAIRYLEAGECVGMFPEGRINFTRHPLIPVRPGAIMIAAKTGVPIVPCFIEDAPYDRVPWSPLFMPARVKVHVGDPIELPKSGESGSAGVDLTELTRRCVQEILRLAGRPDEPIRIAGKKWKPDAAQIERERQTGVAAD